MDFKDRKALIDYLYEHQDISYQKFHQSLKSGDKIIGVRTPILKAIAKGISQRDYQKFLGEPKVYYEEKAILAYLIGYLKIDFEGVTKLINENIHHFDSWALTDGLCANLKKFKKNQEMGMHFIKGLLKSTSVWSVRIGLVLLLDYYIDDEYIDEVLTISTTITRDEYYIKMANAWLISICYIKYAEKTKKILSRLDMETCRMAIQKINDSKRVAKKIKFKNIR